MRDRADTDRVLPALFSRVWRRKPKLGALIQSDQGSVYTSYDWQSFLTAHGLVCNMSCRGNCHDNAPVESFFGLLKRERIRRPMYPAKEALRADVFDDIEMIYSPKLRHGSNGDLPPVEFERRYEGPKCLRKPGRFSHRLTTLKLLFFSLKFSLVLLQSAAASRQYLPLRERMSLRRQQLAHTDVSE
jgi:putative transposase